jgi:hypothetical protein
MDASPMQRGGGGGGGDGTWDQPSGPGSYNAGSQANNSALWAWHKQQQQHAMSGNHPPGRAMQIDPEFTALGFTD